ncbi:MAG: capsular polysaccharide synthesis protein [Bacteroidales bacterium]|nr:capsular polysaccharide synthesis protein [Bacteroidales bacterium]
MIPKKIHYCWFGGKPKPPLVLKCIESWKRVMPEYEIIEWNEKNFDVNSHPYTKLIAKEKKWGFIVDYLRLFLLKEYGGIYLDSDMFMLKKIDNLLENECFTAYEDEVILSCGVVGATKNNPFIIFCLKYYNKYENKNYKILKTGPEVMTDNFEKYKNLVGNIDFIKVYPKNYFYPFDQYQIKKFLVKYNKEGDILTNAPLDSYGVHMWNYSWGHPLNKFIKKIGLHKSLKKIAEFLGVKKNIKKILKME